MIAAKRRFATALLSVLLFTVLTGGTLSARDGSLTINVNGLKNSRGTVRIALFASPEGFPFDTSLAVRTICAPIDNDRAQAVITGVPCGTYALCLYHDENNSGKLGRSAFGRPLEGVGVSNNPSMKGVPRFEEAEFSLDCSALTLQVNVVYFR